MLNPMRRLFQGISTRKQFNLSFKPRGLEEFFENGQALPVKQIETGRAWTAAELRNKSWEDLNKLWYVLLKERNLLATQKEEAARNKIDYSYFSNTDRIVACKKSMARIKTVLEQRRQAYEKAVGIDKTNRRERYKKMYQRLKGIITEEDLDKTSSHSGVSDSLKSIRSDNAGSSKI
ncbi:hypothetical protein BB560_000028 [Smittium megazygosporum]|uniref:Large ribosomal subunit protein uL29m n=1 Tax=Smittium megazygosporum TaxID=133381 RepID=A0A2T9ZLL2_9FUNG|nr:hypothetical protein BB560_000030 [Smittium megazygosporum]PVV05451.1 hypothetical protein BB560_000028 [Smittium megazygosporum]